MKKLFFKIYHFFFLSLYYLKELVFSNIEVAYEVATPKFSMKPGILKISVNLNSDIEIMVFVVLVTMTPGTFALDLSDDRKTMFIHAMYAEDREKTVESIKKLERRVKKLIG